MTAEYEVMMMSENELFKTSSGSWHRNDDILLLR